MGNKQIAILSSRSEAYLTQEINQYLDNGWKLDGVLIVTSITDPNYKVQYTQMMWKKTEV